MLKQRAIGLLARVRGLSMTGRYLLLSFVFVIFGGGVVALSLGQLIEGSAISRTTAVTALYVESFVAPTLQSLATSPTLSQPEIDALAALANNSPLTEKVVSFRIWSTDGHVLYSPFSDLVGRQFDMTGERGQALRGEVIGDISDLSDPENVFERQRWSHLIEIYLPVRVSGGSRVIAVAEFYQLPDDLEAEVNRDRLITWAMVAGATFLAYLALARVVRQGSETIARQQGELQEQVTELSALLGRNARLSARIRQAAARTTALTELERRRIGSDLHDGPTQTLAFAMLRLDALDIPAPAGDAADPADPADGDLAAVRGALDDAMRDIRAIAAGLRTPELEEAGPADIARRAVAEHERRSGSPAALTLGDLPAEAPLATKIALYRILSEALSNATRHGAGQSIAVTVTATTGGDLLAEVSDKGPGFDTSRNVGQGHLGLAGMRERAELLGGRLELVSTPGAGTTVRAFLPLAADVDDGSWAS